MNRMPSLLFFLCSLLLCSAASVFAQTLRVWTNTAAATAWYTAANWNPSTTSSAWATNDTARFENSGTALTAGINMNTASLSIGGIEITSVRTRALTIGNSSTTAGTLTLSGATINSIPHVIVRNASAHNLTLQDNETGTGKIMNIALGSAVTNRVQLDGSGNITISTVILSAGPGTRPLVFGGSGSGRVEITGTANTFTGTIFLIGAEVRFAADGSFGHTNNSIVIDGGRLATVSASTYTLAPSRGIQVSSASGNSISVVSSGTLTYNGVIADVPSTIGSWAKQGGGTLALGGVSTYSGDTRINNGVLQLINGNDRLPTGTTVYMGQASSSNLGVFDLNGWNQTIAGLNSVAGSNANSATNNFVTSASAATLTINGSGSYSFSAGTAANSGLIGGALSLVKSGSGTQFLGQANIYTGKTTINGGALAASGESRFGANPGSFVADQITLDGGAIRAQGGGITFNSNRGLTLGASGGTFDAAEGDITLQNVVTGSGDLRKIGERNVIISGAHTYTGNTLVAEGGLRFDSGGSIANSTNISISGNSTVDVSVVGYTMPSGQSLTALGSGTTGTVLTASGNNLVLGGSNPLRLIAYKPNQPPLVAVGAGSLNLASGTPVSVVVSNGGTALGAGTYKLIAKGATGSVGGTAPSSVTVSGDGLVGGASASLNITGGELFMTVTIGGASAPSVTTSAASATNTTTATVGGNVTSDGGATVTNRGVVWALSPATPTVPGAQTTNGTGTGAFTSTLTNLIPGATYNYRAFAQNSAGTGYGSTLSLTTPCFTGVVLNVRASATNEYDFTAAWDAVVGALGYALDVSTFSAFASSSAGTNTIFRETMGTVSSTTTIAAHESNDGFDNDGYTMSGGGAANPGDVRNTNASTGYTDPLGNSASADANIWFTSTSGEYGFGIGGITNAAGYSSFLLHFGYRKESASANATFDVQWSTNGGATWNSIAVSNLPPPTAAAGWYFVSNLFVSGAASSTNLSLRWVKSGSTAMRIDDVLLQGVTSGSSPSYVPGYSNRAVSGTSQAVTGLTPAVTYYFRVRATNEYCTTLNSATQSVTTIAVPLPGIGVGGNQSVAATLGVGTSLIFVVTNVGGGLLSYDVTNNVSWLTVTPISGTNIAAAGTQSHTLTLVSTGLAVGVHTGVVTVTSTGSGPNAATNSPRTFSVVFTVNAIPTVSAATATNDGNEMIRLAWTKHPSFNVMIVHRETNAPAAPVNGTSYNVGDSLGGGARVIYKGDGSNLQHVVRTGSTNHYAFYSLTNNFYSSSVLASTNVGVYGSTEIVEPFAYTSGVTAANLGGGAGWGTNVWLGNTNRFSVSNLSFGAQADYPAPRANKIAVTPNDGETLGITRRLATPVSSGRLYVSFIMNFQYEGPGKYVGLQLYSNVTERLFVGEVSTADLRLGIDGTSSSRVMTNGIGHDYIVVLRYDWTAGQAVASAFKIGTDAFPSDEPTSWDITMSKASNLVGRIDTVRLVAGTTGSGTPGATYFDEIRIATNWYQLLQIAPPTGTIIYDGFAASSGTLNGGSGGTGWTNNWVLGGDPYADYTPTSFPLSNSCYAVTSGNKVVFYGDVDGRWISATRSFAQPFTTGTVYFSWIQNYAFNGVNKYAGLRLMQDSTEKAFIGKVSTANKALGIADSSANATSSFNLENGLGQDYVIVAKYDFATRELSAVAYRIGSDVIAEDPTGYWHVSTTQSVGHITHISGVRLACGAASGVQIGYVYYDEIRVGTNWYEITRRDGLTQAPAMAAGPVPRLLYVGTNYNPALNPQGALSDITITDAMLANTNDPIDIAVLWSNSFGVFVTNSNGSLNIGSRAGRVNPNFDPVVLAGTNASFQSFGLDAAFTNRIGVNGAVTVTTFQHQAFTLTNTTFNDTFFITLSAENNNLGGGTVPAPNGADAIPAWRALTVNTALQFFVQDDDPNNPEIFEFTINGVGGSGQSNLLPGAIAIIGVNGAGAATDRFSFVTLAPFPAGTRFDFVDCGWDANSNNWYNLAEFHTNAWVASGNIDVGTVIELRLDNINAAGDQVVIYQYDGTLNPTSDPNNVRFIYAVNLGPGWFTNLAYPGGGTNNQNSMLYRGLTNGVNAVSVPISGAANARYIGPTTGTASFILSQIANATNWQSFPSGFISLTNYSFNIIGPGDFDWDIPELSDAEVLAGGYRVTNVARDLDSGIIATNKPYGHAPYFTLSNTNGQIVVSNQFAANFADGTKTPITNRMSAPAGIYERITLGLGDAIVAVADIDNDRPLDTRFKTNQISVLVYDDDPNAPVVGTNAVRVLLGSGALPATSRVEAIAVWNFNDTNALASTSHGAGQMINTITATNNFAGSTVNLFESDPAGRDFAVEGAGNIGRSISFVIDMTGRKDLIVSFAAQRSATGYNSNTISYAVGTGAFVTVESGWSPAASYALKTVDLSAYPEINGAASVSFRITFGTNAVTGAGNNRFDNFQFNADYITYYEVSDGLLATVGATNPLRFSFNAYDSYSGLKRGTANDGTNMTVRIDGLATTNTANYVASLSSAATTNAASTSVWEFASAIGYMQIGDLYADGKSNRFMRANLADADNDRPFDTGWLSNAFFGVWRVIDDDTSTPVVTDINYPNAAARPFVVLTNGGTFAAGETARSLDRRTGMGSNTVWTLTDGDLAASASIGLQFAFGARDVHSGVSRGHTGTTNTVMSFSLGDVLVGNFTNYNAGLSTVQMTTNQVLTNVWSFGSGPFSYSFIGSLMATNIGINPLATTTRTVRVTIPDTDDDRPNDRLVAHAVQVGLVRIADDDARGPVIASAIAEGTTGNEQNYLETFEPAMGWTNTLSFSASWTNTVSNGTYIASGNVLWGSLNPKVSGTRRIGLLTNAAMTNTWLQLPPVTDPGTFAVFAGRFGGEDPSNDVPVSLERLVGSTWSNLGTHTVSALNPEFEMLSWNVNVDGVVTLRLVRASASGVQVYMDDINITPNPEWVSTNQLTVRWTEAVDDFSGVDEYRLVMPAVGTTTPTATNAGSGFAFGVTSHTASIIGQQGILTGFVFAIDNDNDRPNDRAMGNLKPIVVRVDTNPPPPTQGLRATDATAGLMFDPTIDESSEIKVEWRPGGTNEAQAAGWRQSDNVALSPWDSYVIRYYEVADTNGTPAPNAVTITLTRTTAGWSNVLNNWAFTNLVLSNLQFDAYYRIEIQGRDQAGNIGMVTSVIGNTDRFIVTQGLTRAGGGLAMRWTGPTNEAVFRDYDVLFVDAPQGFRNVLSNQWQWMAHTNRPRLEDYGGTNRVMPGALTGTTYRFYRVARQGRWTTNQNPRVASAEIYAAKAIRLHPGENWYSLFSFPDPATTNELESTVAYVFGTNTLPAGTTFDNATRILWFGKTTAATSVWSVATSVVWLSSSAGWQHLVGGSGSANNKRVPLGEGFMIELPTNAAPTNLVLVGRVPTQALVRTIAAPASTNHAEYHILSHQMTERIVFSNFIKQFSGFAGGTQPVVADEIRILNNASTNGVSYGSLRQPRMRIWLSTQAAHSNAPWRLTTSGYPSAMTQIIEPDDAVIVVRRKPTTVVWTNAPTYSAPTKNMSP